MLRQFLRGLVVAALLAFPGLAVADQGSLCMPTAGTISGLQFAQDVNAGFQALVTSNSGNSAPTNPCGGVAVRGQTWLDTSTSPAAVKLFDGTSWQTIGYQDASNHYALTPIGGGTATVASASTADLWSTPENFITISGTTAITQLANASATPGAIKGVVFSGSLTLTYNATKLITPTGASITTAAGDQMLVVATSTTNVRVLAYTRADGSALAATTLGANVVFSGIVTPSAISGSNNDYNPAGISTAAVLRLSASSNATLTGLAAQTAGTHLWLQNISSTTTITLSDASASSSAANRFSIGVSYVLGPLQTIQLIYDGTLSRWVTTGPLPATSAQALAGNATSPFMTPANVAAYVQQGYRYTGTQTFTADGTYTPTAGTRFIRVVLVGGGGAGGGCTSVGAGQVHASGGGGGGAVTLYTSTSISASYAVTIGTAGTGSSGSAGGSGGTTSFGAVATAPGGSGGSSNGGGAGNTQSGSGGSGGTVGTGTIVSAGQPGDAGAAATNGWYLTNGGNGGGGLWGVGGGKGAHRGSTGTFSSSGSDAGGYGAGGGGGGAQDSGGSNSGGDGTPGIVIIEEYA